MLLSDFIRRGEQLLSESYPSPEARGMILMLCEERLGVKSYTHVIEPDTEILQKDLPGLQHDLERLVSGEPIQYVLGEALFCDRRFKVSPAVLIPRPETELLVKEVVTHILQFDHPAKILDLCTGSGCIAWSIFLEVPGTSVVAVDISESALDVAAEQFAGPAPEFVAADVLALVPDSIKDLRFDVIVANPPYVRESEKAQMRRNVLEHEPELALFVPDSDPLLFYRSIALWAGTLLEKGGRGLVEINESLSEETARLFSSAGFSDIEVIDDYFGKPRFISFICK